MKKPDNTMKDLDDMKATRQVSLNATNIFHPLESGSTILFNNSMWIDYGAGCQFCCKGICADEGSMRGHSF